MKRFYKCNKCLKKNKKRKNQIIKKWKAKITKSTSYNVKFKKSKLNFNKLKLKRLTSKKNLKT